MKKFFEVIYWLNAVGAKFWCGTVIVNDRIYYLDSKSDREDLFTMFKQQKQ